MPRTTLISELSEIFEELRPGVPLPEVKRVFAGLYSKISRLAITEPSLADRLIPIVSDLQRLYASQESLIASNPSLDRAAAEDSFYNSLGLIRQDLNALLNKK